MTNFGNNTRDIKEAKKRIREMIWRLLEENNVAEFPKPIYGRIPNFTGADVAARKASKLSVWRKAEVIKANPDSPQKPLRTIALLEGKKVVMASPKLKSGFILIDPNSIPENKILYAASIKGAFMYGKTVSLKEIPQIDLVVTGCVAVDKRGARLGKGGGYAELEYAILREINVVSEETPVLTTIHDLQIVDYIPLEEHDLTVDIAVTPTRIIKFDPRPSKPRGIIWSKLGEKQLLPVIKELRELIKTN